MTVAGFPCGSVPELLWADRCRATLPGAPCMCCHRPSLQTWPGGERHLCCVSWKGRQGLPLYPPNLPSLNLGHSSKSALWHFFGVLFLVIFVRSNNWQQNGSGTHWFSSSVIFYLHFVLTIFIWKHLYRVLLKNLNALFTIEELTTECCQTNAHNFNYIYIKWLTCSFF